MEKYTLLPQQLLYEGTVKEADFFEPTIIDEAIILLTHTEAYWQKLKNLSLSKLEERKTGFPLSAQLIERECIIMQGTLQAALYALQGNVGFNIAGGTHHAYADSGEGFCLLNDIAIAANYLYHNKLAKKIAVVDLDVHQGNGTATIFQGKDYVYTFSMHGEKNYPSPKEKSDWDIGLPDGTTDGTYLKILEEVLPQIINNVKPDFIFYQSGVDNLNSDKLGRLSLSIAGSKQRDALVFEAAYSNQIPVVASMGGGYSENIMDIVEAHANTYRVARDIFS